MRYDLINKLISRLEDKYIYHKARVDTYITAMGENHDLFCDLEKNIEESFEYVIDFSETLKYLEGFLECLKLLDRTKGDPVEFLWNKYAHDI